MYKFYNLLISAFGFFLSLQITLGQSITIDNGDLPQRNQVYRMSTGDSLLQLDPTLTGADYNWDFSNLNPVVQQKDSFLSANDIPLTLRFFFPLGLTFPSDVSLVQYIDTPDSLGGINFGSGFQVYEVRSNLFLGHGFGGTVQGVPLALQNQPPDSVYLFPMNYGNIDSSSTVGAFDLPGVAFYQQSRKRINEVDGWGSLTTPYGTFDVLRIRTAISGRDSLKFDTLPGFALDIPTQIEYKWLAKGQGVPLLQIDATVIGGTEVVSTIRYRDSARAGVPVVSRASDFQTNLRVYPNPAHERIVISSEVLAGKPVRIDLYDTKGQLRKTRHVPTATNHVEFLIPSVPAGVYLLRIESEQGVAIEKIVIQ